MDWLPDGRDVFHLNLFLARNWFQVPNSYDQLAQDQKQRVLTWNVAPGYQHTFGSNMLLTVNAFSRRDQVNYYGSRNPLDDTPVTESQNRFLTNYGVKADLSVTHGRHNFKFGTQLQQTRLLENFSLGVTNPAYTLLFPGLVPYDLTRGGSYFQFHGLGNINQYAFYATDNIKFGNFSIDTGLRDDQYSGLVSKNGIQPRLGLSYLVNRTGTVLRAAYSRTFETPFNENLLLSSATGSGGLAQNIFGAKASVPLQPGVRNQFNGGLAAEDRQRLVIDADYFWKFTHNAYDFDVLFNTPITFPIAWHNSKLDGVTGRLSTTNFHGFQAYMTFGHTRARYFPPENGRPDFPGHGERARRVPHRSRPGLPADRQSALSARQGRPLGDIHLALRQRLVVTGVPDPTRALGSRRAAGGHRPRLRRLVATCASPLRVCGGAGDVDAAHAARRPGPRTTITIPIA